ncbi:MFS allantoate transporter [Apiospora marii]|uniref:MFS allantoate transporter n=1 Tax=Apiospora marii TaxID=335849 RepID=A0ABR1RDW1_9PEZI
MASESAVCQALNLSDGQACKEAATVSNNLFCRFHAKQCYGLYKGYKRRNLKLDTLSEQAPAYFQHADVPLANDDFDKAGDEGVLKDIHDHLFKLYVLLGKVIDARKLHHKHFYPLTLDYGHQAYLDGLTNRRHVVLRALERVEKRTAEVLYDKERWFDWVREVQEDDEVNREKEQKRVKAEAAMFRRHYQRVQARLQAKRQKDEKKRQDAYLEAVYQERRASTSPDEEEDIEDWDPIEDGDDHQQYIDLIRHFMWLELLDDKAEPTASANPTNGAPASSSSTQPAPVAEGSAKKSKAKKKSKSKATKPDANSQAKQPIGHDKTPDDKKENMGGQDMVLAMAVDENDKNTYEPQKANVETESELRTRLESGVKRNLNDVEGPMIVGTLQNPFETLERIAPMTADEIAEVIRDIKEIKQLLFCRILLSHTALLPKALKANSIQEFLEDPEIVDADLRDLCLKLERPTLQDLRDACADLFRGDEPEEEDQEEAEEEQETLEEILMRQRRHGHLSDPYAMFDKFSKVLPTLEGSQAKDDFEPPPDQTDRKMKIRVCGRSIWNYASEKSMSRSGWLHFSIMAKDCQFKHAMELCRNWDEFSELNFLCQWQYFPASNWVNAGSDKLISQLNELNFFPYFRDFTAMQRTHHNEVGNRQRGVRRQHSMVETRNVIVGHMKRNDSVTRRFIQYCIMRAGELLIMVRDGRTGEVITSPEENQLWTWREKHGVGRANKSEWTNILEVGPSYFFKVEMLRDFYLNFDDYYEVWIWDFRPGERPLVLYNTIVEDLRKAARMTKLSDMYMNKEKFLRSITREEDTQRMRSIKPGEQVKSMWDVVTDPSNMYAVWDEKGNQEIHDSGSHGGPSNQFYSEADVAEDMVLFPDELVSAKRNVPFKEITNPVTKMEVGSKTYLQFLARRLKQYKPTNKELTGSEYSSDDSESSSVDDMEDEMEDEREHIWKLPPIWTVAEQEVMPNVRSSEKKRLLERTAMYLAEFKREESFLHRYKAAEEREIMDRDRGIALKQGFHLGDLEPGAQEKYDVSKRMIEAIQNSEPAGNTKEMFWFIVRTMDWLDVKAAYSSYNHDQQAPWPHSFIVQDLVHATACMAPFFRNVEAAGPITAFMDSAAGSEFRESALFRPQERAQTIPDRRTRTGFRTRPKSFWKEWNAILEHCNSRNKWHVAEFPMEWSIAIRPIIAKLYRAGVIAPANVEPHPAIVPGYAIANTEPHRPGKLDLFIDYTDRQGAAQIKQGWDTGMLRPDQWPELAPLARAFVAKHGSQSRFAVLRLWSAPHFYPLMIGEQNRPLFMFLDPIGRTWQWKLICKDFMVSEWSMYHATDLRVELLRRQLGPDRVQHRGEVILVMGTDEAELFRNAVAMTFAIQTKPWLREIDLWKSFINVDLGFLEGLDPYWLD